MDKFRNFKEWFDPYNKQHVEWATLYLDQDPDFEWESAIPNDVVLPNHYGLEAIIRNTLATCWILFMESGLKTRPVTH